MSRHGIPVSAQQGQSPVAAALPLAGERLLPHKGKRYRTRWAAWGLMAAAFAGSLAAAVRTGEAAFCFMAAVLSLVMLISFAAPRIALAGMTAERQLPRSSVRAGEALHGMLHIHSAIPLPFVWFSANDEAVPASSPGRECIRCGTGAMPHVRRSITAEYELALDRGYTGSAISGWPQAICLV
ncbi:hypothetical protein [Paenibacillus protaetiae]|uniref:DUF58 domain-containing protein n=1 Tax=Paenibacillus protaetiae TaxID=2509456 RepID=A0A4P6EZ39_9BACL|nr:hypothetical protein [Paenibacillus protaetiae]QAY67069.1 hypothetical protein ET464_12345 [Paenibacillus protaetiae]